MSIEKEESSFKLLLCSLGVLGVVLAGLGIWLVFGPGVSLMFVGFTLLVIVGIALFGMAVEKANS